METGRCCVTSGQEIVVLGLCCAARLANALQLSCVTLENVKKLSTDVLLSSKSSSPFVDFF